MQQQQQQQHQHTFLASPQLLLDSSASMPQLQPPPPPQKNQQQYCALAAPIMHTVQQQRPILSCRISTPHPSPSATSDCYRSNLSTPVISKLRDFLLFSAPLKLVAPSAAASPAPLLVTSHRAAIATSSVAAASSLVPLPPALQQCSTTLSSLSSGAVSCKRHFMLFPHASACQWLPSHSFLSILG